jgi:transcriptional regulator with XRE-family HTH domain
MGEPANNDKHRERKSAAVTALASNCRRLREAKGWTQGDLADAMEVNQPEISFLENGRANPTLIFLEKLAATLGVTLQAILKAPSSTRTKKMK